MANKHLSEDEIRYTVTVETQKAQKEIYELRQKTSELTKAEKMRRDQMIELEAQGKKYSQEWQNLRKSAEEYHKQIKANNKQMAELTKRLGVSGMTMTQLRKHAKELQRELDNTSQAASPETYAQLEKRLKVVKDRMDELRFSAKSIQETFANNDILNITVGNLYVKLAEWVGHLKNNMQEFIDEGIEMAAQADGITRAFKNLDQPDLLANLREATKGTVNDVELMKAAVQAKDFRIPLEDLGKYLQFAQLKAQQTGQSVEYMTNSIVTGLGRKSLMILDNLGLSASEIKEKMEETGDMMSAVAAIVDKQLAEAGEAYISAADRALQRTTDLQNAQKDLGDAMLPLKEEWDNFIGSGQVTMLQILAFLAKHRELTVFLTTAIVGLNVVTAVQNAQIKSYIANSKLAAFATATWTTAVNGAKGAGLLCAAAYYKLTNQVKQARAAMIAFNAVGKMNVIGLLITLVLGAAAALYLLSKRIDLVAEKQKALNKVKGDAAAKMAEERTQIDLLVAAAKNETLSLEERQRAIDELNRIIPNYNAMLDATTGKYVENKKALDDYLDSLTRQYEIEGAKAMLAELGRERAELNVKKSEEEANRAKHRSFANSMSSVNTGPGSGGSSFGWLLLDLYDEKKLQNINDELDKLAAKEAAIRGQYGQDMQKSAVSATSDTKAGTIGAAIEKVKAEIEALNAERLTIKVGDTEGLERIDKKLQELQKKKAQLEGSSVKTPTSGTKNPPKTNNADTEIVSTFNKSRSADVDAENRAFQAELNALKQHLVQKEITEEQYNVKEQAAKVAHQARLLEIETLYAEQSQSLQISDAGKKEELVNRQNKNLENAQQRSFDAQIEAQRTFQNLMEKLQGAANNETSTNPTERLEAEKKAQLTVLQGYYEASKEYAEQNGLEVQDIEIAYQKAKENLDTQYAEKRKSLEQKTQRELFQIRQQYGLVTQQELYEQQLLLLEQHLEEGKLMEEDYEKAKSRLKRDFYKQQFDNYQSLFHDAVSALQDAEIANINAKYDAEIEAAKGNEEEVERLENEKAQKTLDIQKKYADVNFAIKASQIIADTTVSIMKAYADLGPIAGSVAAALMAVTGAAQLAAANAERKKVKKMTLGNSGGSESKTGARVATGLEKGGRIDVVREQDGKEFPNAEYAPDRRGFIDHPTVIVGEGPVGHSKEFVASNEAVENPTIAPVLAAIDQAQRAGNVRTLDLSKVLQLPAFSGRASGGSVDTSTQPDAATPSSTMSMSADEKKLLQELYALLRHLVDNGVDAFVILSELEKKQQLRDKARNIGSK